MFAKTSVLLALAVAATPALATVYITSPVASTSWTAGTQQTITWEDDGHSPSLADFGNANVAIYVGTQTSQVLVQSLAQAVNVATTSSIAFTPDPNSGENGAYYFVRFDSVGLKDAANPAYPAQAFSSKYTMSGMTGNFNATVQAVINSAASGASTSAAAGATTGAATGASTTKAESTPAKASSTAGKSSSAGASATGAANNAAAASVPASVFTCAAGVAAVVFSAMFM